MGAEPAGTRALATAKMSPLEVLRTPVTSKTAGILATDSWSALEQTVLAAAAQGQGGVTIAIGPERQRSARPQADQ